MLKEWRILLLLFVIGVSFMALGPGYEQRQDDVRLTFTGLQDNLGTEFTGGTRLLLSIESNKTGPELKTLAEEIQGVLRIRANGIPQIRDPTITVVNIDGWKIRLEAATAGNNSAETIKELIAQEGQFEARMPIPVEGTRRFNLTQSYRFRNLEGTLDVDRYGNGEIEELNQTYEVGKRFELENAIFVYQNLTDGVAQVEVVGYSGQDIQEVLESTQRTQGRTTSFQVQLSSEATERFFQIAKNYEPGNPSRGGSQLVLESGEPAMLHYYLDGTLRDQLTVAAVFRTQKISDPSIQTSGNTSAESRREAQRLQSILKSGQLPAPVKVEAQSTLGSSLASEFMTVSILSIVLSLVAVGFLVLVRYRNPKIAIPLVLTGSSEVFILLGLWFSTFGELTLAAVAGIIAAVGTGVDDQIIITDESTDKIQSWTKRMKRAFFVIFTSAASTIGAMVPILSPGFAAMLVGASGLGLVGYTYYSRRTNPHYVAIGAFAVAVSFLIGPFAGQGAALVDIHGFATTTILGIMVGITITRPAYSTILEYIEK